MPPISTFVGREDELELLRELVAGRRLVTVVGPGGIGKTRLVTEVGARLGDAVRRVELAPIAPRHDIGIEVAAQLGFTSVEALMVGLGDAPCVLVLDNCEHVLAATRDLCTALLAGSPALRLLATSREPLGVDGEHLLALGPLGLPAAAPTAPIEDAPAVRLFADRARAAGARWDAGAVAAVGELCRRLDGIPLAIELAAARARTLTPAELLGHLDRRFELLRRAGPPGAARHSSLRAAIDTSYGLLDAGEQAFFRAIGVFAGPFDAALAHAVAAPPGGDRLDTLDQLARLVDRSLVVAEPRGSVTRYRMLDSLRHYAVEQARDAGEADALAERFVDAMTAEADRITTAGLSHWGADVLATILVHFDNLAAAVEMAVARDATAARAFRLLLPLWGGVHQGHPAEVAALGERVLARWPAGDEPWRAEASAVVVNALLVSGQVARARPLAEATLSHPAATAVARVVVLRTLGIMARHEGDLGTAGEHFRAANDAASAAGMVPFARELAVFAASVRGSTGDLEGALGVLAGVCTVAALDDDRISQAWAHLVAAHLLIAVERISDARSALTAAERAQRDFHYPYGRKVAARLRAVLGSMEDGWPATRPLWRATIDEVAATGDLAELAFTLRAAATMAQRAGDRAATEHLLAAVPAGAHVGMLPGLLGPEDATGGEPRPTEALRRLRAVLDDTDAPVAAPARAEGRLARAGDGWTVQFAGRAVQVRHLKGLDDLVVLVGRVDQEVHCLELMGATDVGGGGPVLDEQARRQYRARVRDLQAEIDAARDANDPLHAERAEAELDALVQQLSASFGLGGRARGTGSAVERARSAVTWRIRAAVKRLGEVHPELGRHLGNAVRTGTWCTYRPESPIAWTITAS